MSAIDEEIGRRLRTLRRAREMTTEQVAARAGIRVQEIHAYETGASRISAGRLFQLSKLLDVPIAAFFEDLELAPGRQEQGGGIPDDRGFELAREFDGLPEAQKRAILSLVRSLSFMESAWGETKALRQRDGS